MDDHRMIRLCIIDDIRSVVDMIERKPPWHEYGIEVVGTAMDGEEGLQIVQETRPDIVLTDIRMPRMDGLAMTQSILEVSPAIKIVILSAYTDFSYTQQAIRLGAFDFVKKPFSLDEIVNAVLKAKEAFVQEKEEQTKLLELESHARKSLPRLQQEYVSLLVHHPANEARALVQWGKLGIELAPNDFTVFIVELDRFMDKYSRQPAKEVELIRFSLRNILEETIANQTKGIVFDEAMNRFVCLINCSDNQEAEQISEACCANIFQFTHTTISIGVGLCVRTISELPQAYQQALHALSYRFYTEGNVVNSYHDVAPKQQRMPNYSVATEQQFLFALRAGNKDKCQLILEQIFNELLMADPLPEPQYVENLCYELSAKICRVMLEQFPQEKVQALENGFHVGKGYYSFQNMTETVKTLCMEACGWIEHERSDESTKIIHQAKDYISANLHLNLTLEHCAKQINLSPGYFSNLFKKVLGISFQQFVIHQRMERARTMLIDGYQVQEIAQALGYEHRRYFSEVFKKHTNMTPSEFKLYSTGKAIPAVEPEEDK
ncbi:response regulator [Paenibacillus rigui]|uniref:DNA-binding response regulator n=1 Tax=Paenibacillus rigui TaxID=554312 RepID=A0A229UI04_9BACL|nr:response regulator [Paenibacillus rigui]OXM83068.1 DNA-binding response regulator [Paenibacillus rigui]